MFSARGVKRLPPKFDSGYFGAIKQFWGYFSDGSFAGSEAKWPYMSMCIMSYDS